MPGTDAESAGVLEASFDPDCRLGEWDFQMLGAAAHLAALQRVLQSMQTALKPGFSILLALKSSSLPPLMMPRAC